MKRTPLILLLLFTAAMMLAATPTLAAEKHLLVLDRAHAVGDKHRLKLQGSGNEANSSSMGGQKLQSAMKTMSGTMTAVVETLAVHEDESVRQAAFTIEKFTGTYNGKPVEIDTTKRLIVTGEDDSTTYAYENGGTIEATETVELLNLITDHLIGGGSDEDEGEDGPSDEQLFNLKEPKAVGESWACNNKLMAEDLAEEGILADPEKMKSEMTFVAVKEYNGQKCANLVVDIDFGPVSAPELEEQGFVIDKSSLTLGVQGLIPLDTEVNDGSFELEMKMKMTASVDIPQGRLRVDLEGSQSMKIFHLPIKD